MIEKLKNIIKNYEQIQDRLSKPEIAQDIDESIKLNKELSSMSKKYELAKKYIDFQNQIDEAKQIIGSESDPEMLEMAKEQKNSAEKHITNLEEELKIALLPTDPNDDKNIFFEIRPAAGGNESALFASELLRMYMFFAQKKGRKIEIVEEQLSDIGGLKFAMIKIKGDSVYSIMKFESGVHRVQRIPETESQGRVHTSTVTIAIMPEVENVDVNLDMNDIIMDTYAASSAGGQNANKNQTGVRLHHKPTGIIVDIGDSKSQGHNKEKAIEVLKAKLFQIELDKQQKEQKALRGNQIGSGDRSEKIRTYNFPQDRVTDHRIKQSWSNLPGIMQGNIDDILDALILENQSKLISLQTGE